MGGRDYGVTIDDGTTAEVSAIAQAAQRYLPWKLEDRRIATADDALHIFIDLGNDGTCGEDRNILNVLWVVVFGRVGNLPNAR